jgi:hypothetical protein
MDIQERLDSLQERINSATQQEARHEVLRERAMAEREEALKTLKEKFGVDSVEEAQKLLLKLEKSLKKDIEKLETQLDNMGA